MKTPARFSPFRDAARTIQNNWETIAALEGQVLDRGNQWITEMALQGQRLIHIKTQLKHGDWLPWCQAHAGAAYDKINRCMKIAANFARVQNLDAGASLRQVLAICAEKAGDPAPPPAQHSLPYITGINKFSKFNDFLLRNPLPDWPREGVEQLKEDLEPVAKQLWPEKFNDDGR